MPDASAESRKLVGQVVSVSGSQASIELDTSVGAVPSGDVRITVGKFLAIRTMGSSVVSVITNVDGGGQKAKGQLTARVDLLGELKEGKGRSVRFQRGITDYPIIGDAGRAARQRRAAPDLRHGQRRHHQHRPAAAGRLDRRPHQDRGHAGQALRAVRRHRRRQVERRRRHPAPGAGGAAGSARLPDRPAQRVRPFLRRPGARAEPEEPAAAVLAVQLRGDGRRLLPRPSRAWRRRWRSSPSSSRRPRTCSPARATARRNTRCASSTRAPPDTRSTRPCPTGCRISSA